MTMINITALSEQQIADYHENGYRLGGCVSSIVQDSWATGQK